MEFTASEFGLAAYEITRNRCEISTLTPEQKLRDDGLCI